MSKKNKSVRPCHRCGQDASDGAEGYCKRCCDFINREFEKYRNQQICKLKRDMRP